MAAFNKRELAVAIEKLNLLELRANKTVVDRFTSLPLEMLWQVFDICDLKDQLSLAKVCKLFCQLVSEILTRRYRNFVYNYLDFKFSFNLEDEEISQFCLLVGQNVTRLRFSTSLDMDLLYTQLKMGAAPIEKLDYILTGNFRENLKYFPNLLEMEIQSKYVCDKTFLELAKRCQKLTSIKMINWFNLAVEGKYLADLRCIEHLELKCCYDLDPKHLRAVSNTRPLKTLNIVGCRQMEYVQKIVKICKISQHLQTLRLTAFTRDPRFFKAILSLPLLKCLQLFWVDDKPQKFEGNFLAKLKENSQKCLSLKALKFENDHDFLKSHCYINERIVFDEKCLQQWIHEPYALKREKVCIYEQPWQWTDDVFEAISKALKSFTHLQSIDFNYCRILRYEQLQQIPEICKNLKLITISGCPREEDVEFHKQWLGTEINCQLKFESVLSWEDVLNLRSEPCQFPEHFSQIPVIRSIECLF